MMETIFTVTLRHDPVRKTLEYTDFIPFGDLTDLDRTAIVFVKHVSKKKPASGSAFIRPVADSAVN